MLLKEEAQSKSRALIMVTVDGSPKVVHNVEAAGE
jgi:hypothetical protein